MLWLVVAYCWTFVAAGFVFLAVAVTSGHQLVTQSGVVRGERYLVLDGKPPRPREVSRDYWLTHWWIEAVTGGVIVASGSLAAMAVTFGVLARGLISVWSDLLLMVRQRMTRVVAYFLSRRT